MMLEGAYATSNWFLCWQCGDLYPPTTSHCCDPNRVHTRMAITGITWQDSYQSGLPEQGERP